MHLDSDRQGEPPRQGVSRRLVPVLMHDRSIKPQRAGGTEQHRRIFAEPQHRVSERRCETEGVFFALPSDAADNNQRPNRTLLRKHGLRHGWGFRLWTPAIENRKCHPGLHPSDPIASSTGAFAAG